jgi:hypothetical protein
MKNEIGNNLSTQRRENIRYHNSRHFKKGYNLFEDKNEMENQHYIEGVISFNHHMASVSGVKNKEVSFNSKCSVILVPDNIQLREENLRGTIWYTRKELDNMLYTTALEVSNLMLKRKLSYCDALRQICEI